MITESMVQIRVEDESGHKSLIVTFNEKEGTVALEVASASGREGILLSSCTTNSIFEKIKAFQQVHLYDTVVGIEEIALRSTQVEVQPTYIDGGGQNESSEPDDNCPVPGV